MEDLIVGEKFIKPKRVRPARDVNGTYTPFTNGDVLLAKITPCFENGKVAIARGLSNGIGFGSSEYIVFRPNAGLDEEYLYYYLSRPSFRIEGATQMRGAVGHKRIPKDFVTSYPIPVPPLSEQKRIVGILDKAFESIAIAKLNTGKALENTGELFESAVDSAMGRDSQCPQKRLSDLCRIGDGNHSSNYPKKSEMVPSGIPFIRATNLVDGKIHAEGMRFISPAKHAALKKGHLKKGDILFSNRGEIGNLAYVDERYDNANLNSQLAWLRCGHEITSSFLFYALSSRTVREQVRNTTTGAALQQLTIRQLGALRVPCPSLDVQNSVTVKVEQIRGLVDELSYTLRAKLQSLTALSSSLLDAAFNGEL